METPVLLTAGNQAPLQAMYVNFSSTVLQQVLNGHADISLIFSDDNNTGIQINDVRYRAQINEEASRMDIYSRHATTDNLKAVGRLSHRVWVQNTATNSAVSNDDRKMVMHVLALGPLSIDDIISKAKVSLTIAQAVIKEMGEPVATDSSSVQKWILKEMAYASLDCNWESYTDAEKKLVESKSSKCFEKLANANGTAEKINPKPEKVDKAHTSIAKVPNDSRVSKNTTKKAAGGAFSSSAAPSPELLHLARKFKKKYIEYEQLYSLASDNGSSDQIKQLLDLHNQLSSWKKQLWAASK